MRLRLLIVLFVLILVWALSSVVAQDNEGIPDDCENTRAEYYRDGLFARYEPQNHRLILVSWYTGEDVQVVATDLDDTLIRGWSWNCRYLAVATGSYESRDTVVYDTLSNTRLGAVPDAYAVPHTITWGPGEYLVVETRNGAVLWDVPRNVQYTYDTGFHTTLHRNFTNIRWDVENQQLTLNLAVGGRMVIDLTTGELTVSSTSGPGEIIIGGERFYCERDDRLRDAHRVGNLRVGYEPEGGLVALYRWPDGIVATIEAHIEATTIRTLGWSENCRYVAAAVGVPGTRNWDTYVWEFETRRRVGVFPDAHSITHPISWDTAETHLFIQTRDGAYLWNLETDERVQVNEVVQQVCSTSTSCYWYKPLSFHSVYWDAGREQFLGVPVQSPNSVVAYNVHTGAEEARYTFEGVEGPIEFITSNDSRLIIARWGEQATLWNRNSDAVTTFSIGTTYGDFRRNAAISTDNHFFVHASYPVRVWDLTTISNDAAPIAEYYPRYFSTYYGVYFINGHILDSGSPYNNVRLNVATGEVIGNTVATSSSPVTNIQSPVAFSSIEGTSGSSTIQPDYRSYWWREDPEIGFWDCPELPYYDADTRQLFLHNMQTGERRLIADDLNDIGLMEISPDCRTLYSEIRLLNTGVPFDLTPANRTRRNYRWDSGVVFWDVATGIPFISFEDYPDWLMGYSRIWWSPDSERALLRTPQAYFLVNVRQQTIAPLGFRGGRRLTAYPRSYWDYSRGILIATGSNGAFAFDMHTGEELLNLTVLPSGYNDCGFVGRGCGLSFSEDHEWVFVYGDSILAVWNISTLQHAYLPVQTPRGSSLYGAQISPDGRYVIVSRSAVRVWDISNLSDDGTAGDPIATFGVGNRAVESVRFVDNTVIEVVTRTNDGLATTRYEITTGAVVGSE